jgi:hypothetical protein
MDGKISEIGFLEIKRGSDYTVQRCHRRDDTYCGDHCPMFNEPENNNGYSGYSGFTGSLGRPLPSLIEEPPKETICLHLCEHRTLKFREFYDLRP